jgi:hypothetical protein
VELIETLLLKVPAKLELLTGCRTVEGPSLHNTGNRESILSKTHIGSLMMRIQTGHGASVY